MTRVLKGIEGADTDERRCLRKYVTMLVPDTTGDVMQNLRDEVNALQMQLAHLQALEQIRRAVYQCARALDRLDRELLLAQFWPDAQIDYGNLYRGPIAGFADIAMQFQSGMRDTQHLVSNITIQLEGDAARSESYVHAQHVISEGDELVQLSVGGRYLDSFSRRSEIWRLSSRTEVLDWGRRVPIKERWFETNTELVKGRRDADDASHKFLTR